MITLADMPIAFVILCWVIFVIVWIAAAPRVKKVAAAQDVNWNLRFALIAIALILLMNGVPAISALAGVRLLPKRPEIGLLADALALIGLLVMLWARAIIGKNWSGEVVLRKDHELAMTGPYAYVRHPIYSGLLLLMLATAMAFGVVSGFVVFVTFFAVLLYKSRIEERFMAGHFPETYTAYMKKTKALVPFVF